MPTSMQIDRSQVRVGDVLWHTNVGAARLTALGMGAPVQWGGQTYVGATVQPMSGGREAFVTLGERLTIDAR
jgi:hypothetical protein